MCTFVNNKFSFRYTCKYNILAEEEAYYEYVAATAQNEDNSAPYSPSAECSDVVDTSPQKELLDETVIVDNEASQDFEMCPSPIQSDEEENTNHFLHDEVSIETSFVKEEISLPTSSKHLDEIIKHPNNKKRKYISRTSKKSRSNSSSSYTTSSSTSNSSSTESTTSGSDSSRLV